MNSITVILLILIFSSFYSLVAQPPAPGQWQDDIPTIIVPRDNNPAPTGFLYYFDVEMNWFGTHIVADIDNGGNQELHYYLIGNDGEKYLDDVIATNAQHPAVAIYNGITYVIYSQSNKIRGKKGEFSFDQNGNLSVTWSNISERDAVGNAFETDAYADFRGVHVVWQAIVSTVNEVYYSLYDFDNNVWPIAHFKNITDEIGTLTGAEGRDPSVITTPTHAYVVYHNYLITPVGGGNEDYDSVVRVRGYDFSSWQNSEETINKHDTYPVGTYPFPLFRNVSIAHFNNEIHIMGHYFGRFTQGGGLRAAQYLHNFKDLSTGNWEYNPSSANMVREHWRDQGGLHERTRLFAEVDKLQWIYRDNSGFTYEYYTSLNQWGNGTTLMGFMGASSFDSPTFVNANKNSLNCFWIGIDDLSQDIRIFHKRKVRAIFEDITEHSYWTGDVWIGDTDPPREEITIPTGVTVTLDPDATLYLQGNWIHVYGEFYFDPGNVVFDGGEIFIHPGGIAYNTGSGISTISGDGSCIWVNPEGKFINSESGIELRFDNQALFVNNGGYVELSDYSKMVFDETSDKLDIRPGSTIKMGRDAKIEVNSRLIAESNAIEPPITITSLYEEASPQDCWSWIKIIGQGAGEPEPSSIKYATIEYGDYGLYVYNAHPVLENNTIQDNYYYNVYLSNSNASLSNNIIRDSKGYYGIYMYNSSPELYNNLIDNNQTKGGIYCYSYSSPKLGYDNTGNNVIKNNLVGLYARSYSKPFLGESDTPLGGYNSIYNNVNYAIQAMDNCEVLAHLNWWGAYPLSENWFYTDATSSIDYSNALKYDPNEEMISKSVAGTAFNSNHVSPFPPNNPINPRLLLKSARSYRYQKQPVLALGVYKQLINNFPNNVEARWGLIEILDAFVEARKDSSVNFLKLIVSIHPNGEMKRVAFDLLSAVYIEKGNISEAISNCQRILSNYPDTESEKIALFDLFNIFWQSLKDFSRAQSVLILLEQKYPNDELTQIAQHQIGGGTGKTTNYLSKGSPVNTESMNTKIEIPHTFKLLQNYPNPFNPKTVIEFELSEPSSVKLEIYDIFGRKVRTLVNRIMEAGHKKAIWDGRNDSGNPVTSGVYLYYFEAGGYQDIRKMVLVK